VGPDQSVLVTAGNDYSHVGVAGAAAISGTVAVTPGVDVTVVNNDTSAYIGQSAKVDAQKDVEVSANAAEDVLSVSVSISGSGTVSVAGAVSVISLNTYACIYRQQCGDQCRWQCVGDGVRCD
jgi:hypothetical protein